MLSEQGFYDDTWLFFRMKRRAGRGSDTTLRASLTKEMFISLVKLARNVVSEPLTWRILDPIEDKV